MNPPVQVDLVNGAVVWYTSNSSLFPCRTKEQKPNLTEENEIAMYIHSLKLSLTEQEINELATTLTADHHSVQNLRVRLTPEGIVVLGEYPTMLMKMAFETVGSQGRRQHRRGTVGHGESSGSAASMLRRAAENAAHLWLGSRGCVLWMNPSMLI